MANPIKINNSFYDYYGERWYTADDDPVALLRLENKVKAPWILSRINKFSKILDVGCGAGFLTNQFALAGHDVTGVDQSEDSLRVAHTYDRSGKVRYLAANAYELPFDDETFDVVTSTDFLEHIDDPEKVIKEFSRVLKPGGTFFFHTFNRNPLSWLVAIKMIEWLIPKTPKNMHVLKLFIKPIELQKYCENAHLKVIELTGIKPVISSIPIKRLFSGKVPDQIRFELTRNLSISYMGKAVKSLA